MSRGRGGALSGIDRCTGAFFIFAASFYLIRIPLYALIGADGAARLIPALELFVLFYASFVLAGTVTMRRCVRTRRLRRRTASIPGFVSAAGLPTLLAGLILAVLLAALSTPAAGVLGADRNMFLLFVCLAPSILFLSITGILRGYEEGMLVFGGSFLCYLAEAALTAAGALIGGRLAYNYGVKAAALLRNPSVAAIYGAFGAALGISAASLISLLLQLGCHLLSRGTIREYLESREELKGEPENLSDIRRAYWSSFLLTAAAFFFLTAPVLTDYRLSFHFSSLQDAQTRLLWASFGSKALPPVVMAALLLILPFPGFPARLGWYLADRNRKEFRKEFGILMRLAGYLLIPVSFFFMAASHIITSIGFGIDDKTAETALAFDAPAVYFLGIALLLVMLYLSVQDLTRLLLFTLAAYAVQTALCIMLLLLHVSPELSGAVSFLVFTILLSALLLFGFYGAALRRNRWVRETVMAALCAVAAAIPVFLLSVPLYDHIGALPALLVLGALYLAVYVLLTIFLRVCDLRELHRIPGGDMIVMLSYLLGR